MKTSFLTLPLAALTLGACASSPAAPPETFDEWVARLPEVEVGGFTPYQGSFVMEMAIDLLALGEEMNGVEIGHEEDGEPADLVMKMEMKGEFAHAALDTGSFDMSMMMDFGALAGDEIPGPVDIGFYGVCDGDTLYLQPDWRTDWLTDELDSGGDGFSDMVFTVNVSTMLNLIDKFSLAMDEEMPGLFGEGGYKQMMEDNIDLAAWMRSLDQFCEIYTFEVVENEVHLTFGLSEEFAEMVNDPQFPTLSEDLQYALIADLDTGVPRIMEFSMGAPLEMTMRMELEVREPGSWPADAFQYSLPEGRSLFPIDMFVDLAANMMVQQAGVGGGDYEF